MDGNLIDTVRKNNTEALKVPHIDRLCSIVKTLMDNKYN